MARKDNAIAAQKIRDAQDAALLDEMVLTPDVVEPDEVKASEQQALVIRGALHGHMERLQATVHDQMGRIGDGITELCDTLRETAAALERANAAAKTQKQQVETFIKLQGLHSAPRKPTGDN